MPIGRKGAVTVPVRRRWSLPQDPGASEARNAVVISNDDGVTWSSATELTTVGHLLLGVAIT